MPTLVRRIPIPGTNVVVFSAWTPVEAPANPATRMDILGEPYGQIGTDPDRTLFYHLPEGSQERTEALAAAYVERYAVAYAAILAAHPEAAAGDQYFGEITLTVGG